MQVRVSTADNGRANAIGTAAGLNNCCDGNDSGRYSPFTEAFRNQSQDSGQRYHFLQRFAKVTKKPIEMPVV
jgi:hypothetical protein